MDAELRIVATGERAGGKTILLNALVNRLLQLGYRAASDNIGEQHQIRVILSDDERRRLKNDGLEGMTTKPDGGPAYPHDSTIGHERYVGSGMTIRDYFAGQAAQGILAGLFSDPRRELRPLADDEWDHLATKAGRMADAMIAERDKRLSG